MTFMRRLEKLLGWAVVPDLTLVLVIGQAVFALLAITQTVPISQMTLQWQRVFAGEVWRVMTFPFTPSSTSLLFALLSVYVLFWMGRLVQGELGTFRFNLFVWLNLLMTAAATLLDPGAGSGSAAIYLSLLLAIGWMAPDYQVMLFFVIPVKVKYLALLALGFSALALLQGIASRDLTAVVVVLSSLTTFVVFFGRELWGWVRRKRRGMAERDRKAKARETALHRCVVCKRTELTHPELTFRYVPDADGEAVCYCEEDLP